MEKILYLSLLLLLLAVTKGEDKTKGKEEEKFDGVGVGLIERPRNCKKTSRKGDLARVTFNVSIGDGNALDTRYEKEPLELIIGDGQMIGGFDAGLEDMCVGEIRHLTIPPQHAYGSNAVGNIPSRVDLLFFVKMISFSTPTKKDAKKDANIFNQIDTSKDSLLSHEEVQAYLEKQGIQDQPGEHGVKQVLRDIFREEDRNVNGYIDHNEFSGVRWDSHGDEL